jgi:hypothetical protein
VAQGVRARHVRQCVLSRQAEGRRGHEPGRQAEGRRWLQLARQAEGRQGLGEHWRGRWRRRGCWPNPRHSPALQTPPPLRSAQAGNGGGGGGGGGSIDLHAKCRVLTWWGEGGCGRRLSPLLVFLRAAATSDASCHPPPTDPPLTQPHPRPTEPVARRCPLQAAAEVRGRRRGRSGRGGGASGGGRGVVGSRLAHSRCRVGHSRRRRPSASFTTADPPAPWRSWRGGIPTLATE